MICCLDNLIRFQTVIRGAGGELLLGAVPSAAPPEHEEQQ
jgi:hypothetical protein